jgi:hypothetical protein
MKADEIRLRGGITIGVHSNSYRHVRGRTLLACLFDESAFWRDESSSNPDVETYRAVLPSLATTGGMLIGISSPYRKIGLLYTRHRDYFGKDDPDTLIVAGSSQQFNSTLNSGTIDKARRDDPEAARSEWDGLFREDISSLLDDALIDAAVEEDRPLELSPAGHYYLAFLDPSGGKHDCYTCCIGHVTVDGVFVADVVRGEKPPLDPAKVTARYVALARSYGTSRIISDAYAGEWVSKAIADAGGIHEV